MKPKPNIVHLPVYKPGTSKEEVKKRFGIEDVIKLASNENPFGCSPAVREALVDEFDRMSEYPDGASVELTHALSKHLNVEPNQIIFGNGSDEVVLMIARAYLQPGDETIMAVPTFPQYKHNAEVEGATVIEVPLKNGVHDLEEMVRRVTERTKIIWICNPNNPTGTMNTHEEMVAMLEKVPQDVLVVLDEAYYEYVADPDYPDSLSLIQKYPNVLVLRTFSKIYGLAALRIGYGIGRVEVIHTINQVREPFNTSRFAQRAALVALKDQAFIEDCRQKNLEGISYLSEQFEKLGLKYFPTVANFIMVDVARPAKDVYEGLLEKGIIVRGGHNLGMPTHLRVTVGSREQNEKFIAALEQVLQQVPAAGIAK